MSLPSVAIVVIQRERYSPTMTCLSRLMAATRYPFHLIYVDGNSPLPVNHYLQRMAKRHLNLKLIRLGRHLRGNEARNYAISMLPEVDYVVFMDNDVLVEPGWLEQLITTAEQEKADAVMPLVMEGNGRGVTPQVHSAGWRLKQTTLENGCSRLEQTQRCYHPPQPDKLTRHRVVNGIEFHCFLMRASLLSSTPLDSLLDGPFGELDLNLQFRQQSRRLLVDLSTQVTFLNPQLDPSFEPTDLPLYRFRWSDRALKETSHYLARKWNLCSNSSVLSNIRRHGVAHRQLPLQRSAATPWKLMLQCSKLSGCPSWLRSRLESHLHRHPIHLAPALGH